MGYTHYFSINKEAAFGRTAEYEQKYQLALRQCARIAKNYNARLKAVDKKHPNRLSGFTVHTPISKYGGLHINGTAEFAHEDFCLREHFTQNQGGFCKTARKPYDVVITACLITLKHYLGQGFQVESDGLASDWIEGLELAKKVTRIKTLDIPATIYRKFEVIE